MAMDLTKQTIIRMAKYIYEFYRKFRSSKSIQKNWSIQQSSLLPTSTITKKKTEQAKAVYDKVDRKRLTKKQDAELDFLFVNLLKSGVEVREDTSPYFVMLESGINQATDLAIADYNETSLLRRI